MTKPDIPLFNLGYVGDDDMLVWGAVTRVLQKRQFIGGDTVRKFELAVADKLGVAAAVGVGSGTAGLTLALKALRAPPGATVIVPALTFTATASAVVAAGLRPLIVDVDSTTLQLSPSATATAIQADTVAVIAVHMFGHPAPLEDLRAVLRDTRRPIRLIEDACQAFGARVTGGQSVGSVGDAAVFSFFPTKPLGGIGDGGMVVSNDPEYLSAVRRLATHGGRDKYYAETPGYNSRLDAVQAAALMVKLRSVQQQQQARARFADIYSRALRECARVHCPAPHRGHAWHLYALRSTRRDAIQMACAEAGIQTGIHYPTPLHQMAAFEATYPCPSAERAARMLVSLPLHASLTAANVQRVIDVVTDVVQAD